MKRGCLVAIVIFTAALVMAVGVALFFGVSTLFPRYSGYEALAKWVEENLDAELKTGYVAPVIYPGIGVQIRDFDLRIDREGHKGEFFRADAIKVVADFGILWSEKKLAWREIIIEEPKVVVIRDEDGKIGVVTWAKNMPVLKRKTDKEEKKEDDNYLVWLLKDSLKRSLPKSGTELIDLMSMNKVAVEELELIMIDRGTGKKLLLEDVRMRDVNLVFRGQKENQEATLNLDLPFPQGDGYNPEPFSLSARLTAPSNDRIEVSDLKIKWASIKIDPINGWLDIRPELKFDANLEAYATFPDIRRAAMWGPVARSRTMPDMRGSGGGRIIAHVWGPDMDRLSKVHYEGRVELEGLTYDPGRVISPIKGMRTTIYLEDGVLRMPTTTVMVDGARIKGSGKMIESKYPKFLFDLETDYVNFEEFFAPRRTPYERGKPMLTMRTRWGGKAKVGEGAYGKMQFTDLEGEWNVTNKRYLTMPELRLNSCGGSYVESGKSWVDFNHPVDYKFNFDGRLRNIDVTCFVDQVFDTTTFLHGKVDATGYVDGMFSEGEFVPRSMDGKMDITVRDGYFEGFNLLGNLLGVFNIPLPEELKGQAFNRMSATISIEKAVAYFDDLAVEAPGLGAEAKGWIDFASQHTDIKVTIHPRGRLSDAVSRVPIIGPTGKMVTTLYVRAHGHFDYLKYEPWNPLDADPVMPPENGTE